MADSVQEGTDTATPGDGPPQPSELPSNTPDDKENATSTSKIATEYANTDEEVIDSSNPLAARLRIVEERMKELKGSGSDTESESDDPDERYYALRTQRKLLRNAEFLVAESSHLFRRLRSNRERRRRLKNIPKDDQPDTTWIASLDEMEEKSEKAIASSESAKMVWVNWATFIQLGPALKHYVMSPIQAINSEPEPHTVLSHAGRTSTAGKKLGSLEAIPAKRSAERDPLPERIHLRSFALEYVLAKVGADRDFIPGFSTVLLRPYRILVYYEKQFKDLLASLEQNMQHPRDADQIDASETSPTETAQTKNPEEKASAQESTEHRSPETTAIVEEHNDGSDNESEASERQPSELEKRPCTATFHLRCLMRFVDSYVKPTIEYLESDRCEDVFFHDLWHLFRPGTEVIDQMGKQAYRVFRVQTARHKVEEQPWLRWSKAAESDDEVEDQSPFKLHCAYIDFDGKSFGPVTKIFIIAPFSGLQPVTKLPVYPLRLAKSKQLRLQLIERGRTLLSVSKFRAMYYTGHTLGTKEEVDSQVVVDCAEALIANKEWTPQFNGLKATNPGSRTRCEAPCCYRLPIHHDEYVDTALAEDFIKTLIASDTTNKASSLLLTPRAATDLQAGTHNEPTDEELVVMTYRVFGFVLRSRKWGKSVF